MGLNPAMSRLKDFLDWNPTSKPTFASWIRKLSSWDANIQLSLTLELLLFLPYRIAFHIMQQINNNLFSLMVV